MWFARHYGGSVVKDLPASVGVAGSIPGSGRWIPWREKWQHTPVFLPEKYQVKEEPGVHRVAKDSDMT